MTKDISLPCRQPKPTRSPAPPHPRRQERSVCHNNCSLSRDHRRLTRLFSFCSLRIAFCNRDMLSNGDAEGILFLSPGNYHVHLRSNDKEGVISSVMFFVRVHVCAGSSYPNDIPRFSSSAALSAPNSQLVNYFPHVILCKSSYRIRMHFKSSQSDERILVFTAHPL